MTSPWSNFAKQICKNAQKWNLLGRRREGGGGVEGVEEPEIEGISELHEICKHCSSNLSFLAACKRFVVLFRNERK